MIPFEMAEGNPGTLTFILSAYNDYPMTASRAMFRMEKNGITGCALYMLWNDCCNRDTRMALEAARYCPIKYLKEHINKEGGYGFEISKEVISKHKNLMLQLNPRYNYW